ncbi:MAG: MFS transporter [Chloroflexales bacterium]|nr:MFS transporter [Chloroflexales bacterium]
MFRERWQRTLWIMFFAQVVSAIGFASIFPFLPLYVASLGSQTGLSIEFWSGMVFSSQAITMMIASPIWGSLADRYGRKIMVERAMFGGTVVILLMAFVRSAEELVLLRTIQGFITGTVSAANALVAAVVPRERMGYAMGVLQVGLWAGVAIGPLIGGVLADTLGYSAAFIVTAALLFLSGLMVLFGIKEENAPSARSRRGSPGLLTQWWRISIMPGVFMTFTVRFISGVGQMLILPIAPLFIQSLLTSDAPVGTLTGLIVGISSATGTASAIYLGRLGDRIGHRRVLIISSLLAALFYLPQSLVTDVWQLLVLQAITGAAMGGIMPPLSALLAQYTPQGEEGAVYGLDSSVLSGSRAVAPLVGAAVAVWLGLRGIFVVNGLVCLCAALCAIWWLPKTPVKQIVPETVRQEA